jgi:hypothetical protein
MLDADRRTSTCRFAEHQRASVIPFLLQLPLPFCLENPITLRLLALPPRSQFLKGTQEDLRSSVLGGQFLIVTLYLMGLGQTRFS